MIEVVQAIRIGVSVQAVQTSQAVTSIPRQSRLKGYFQTATSLFPKTVLSPKLRSKPLLRKDLKTERQP